MRGGGIGALLATADDCNETGGKEVCFFIRGGAGGSAPRSELDEIFERVSSFEVLLL